MRKREPKDIDAFLKGLERERDALIGDGGIPPQVNLIQTLQTILVYYG